MQLYLDFVKIKWDDVHEIYLNCHWIFIQIFPRLTVGIICSLIEGCEQSFIQCLEYIPFWDIQVAMLAMGKVFLAMFFYFPCADTGNQYQTNCNFFFLMGFKGIFFPSFL